MKWVEKIETGIIYVLMAMLVVAVLIGTGELGRSLVEMLMESPTLLIQPKELFQSFGNFLIILIGLELLKLLKLHVQHHKIQPTLVIEVAIIAICNKVVTLDLKSYEAASILGLAALLLALVAGYYVFSREKKDNE